MDIKAADVAKLRKMTGAGMMDCKKALVEANGDYDKAQEIIREKGKLVAAKRADRETSEGSVVAKVSPSGNTAVLVCLGCETDFVANTAEFKEAAALIADAALAALPADKDELMNVKTATGQTVAEVVTAQTGKTGEKHAIPFYAKLVGNFIAPYIHMNSKVSSIVAFNKTIDAHVGKEIAMQVTAMNPVSISRNDCPKEVVKKELEIAVEKTKEEQVMKAVEAALKKAGINPAHVDSDAHIESNMGKGWITPEQAQQAREIKKTVAEQKAANLPEAMIQNIAQGRLAKFFKESTLEEQEFVQIGKISVKEYLAGVDPQVKVTGFCRFSLCD